MSGGDPSSIKRKPSCAAELPILSPNCGKAAGRTLSNRPCAVLWGAEREIRLKPRFQSKRCTEPAARIQRGGTKVLINETFAPTGVKSLAELDIL